jgi:predicted  nucleic acid-binding Zn-ribbon protein
MLKVFSKVVKGKGMEESQNGIFERFHQAILSMESQLISLYEDKLNNTGCSVSSQVNSAEIDNLRQVVADLERDLQLVVTERDGLINDKVGLQARCSTLERQLIELQESQNEAGPRNEGSPDLSGDNPVAQQTLKVMRKNVELANLNAELGNKITALASQLEDSRGEIQRLKASGEEVLLEARRELQEELLRVKHDLQQQKAKFRELGASIMERFFDE